MTQTIQNDKFVAFDLLKNANTASGKFPLCQDTGTAIVIGSMARTFGSCDDERQLLGIDETYQTSNLRYSQLVIYKHVRRERHRHQSTSTDRNFCRQGNPINFYSLQRAEAQPINFCISRLKLFKPYLINKFSEKEIKTIGTSLSALPPARIGGASVRI